MMLDGNHLAATQRRLDGYERDLLSRRIVRNVEVAVGVKPKVIGLRFRKDIFGDSFERRAVGLGKADDLFVEIRSGLKLGEVVAVTAVYELQTAFASVK